MVTLNPLKYDVIVFSGGRWINKWKIFILGSNVALSPGHKFPVNGLIYVFCKLWLAKELFMVTIHISILELYGWSSKQQFYFSPPWTALGKGDGLTSELGYCYPQGDSGRWWDRDRREYTAIFRKLRFLLLNTSRALYLFTCNLEIFFPSFIFFNERNCLCLEEARGVWHFSYTTEELQKGRSLLTASLHWKMSKRHHFAARRKRKEFLP